MAAPVEIRNFTPLWSQHFDADLMRFMRRDGMGNEHGWKDPFIRDVARPMYMAWMERKEYRGTGESWARLITDDAWRIACMEWIGRRKAPVAPAEGAEK
jgi:hypothetical protein